jgi:hypothetical protein
MSSKIAAAAVDGKKTRLQSFNNLQTIQLDDYTITSDLVGQCNTPADSSCLCRVCLFQSHSELGCYMHHLSDHRYNYIRVSLRES